jgi:hypothetical protein
VTRRQLIAWLAGFLFGAAGFFLAAYLTLREGGVL